MSARRGLGELLSLTSKHIGAFEGSILHKVSSLHTTSRAIGSTANSSVWSGDVRHGMGRQLQSLRGFASGGGKEVVHGGLKLHATGGWHKAAGTAMASVMWFWFFYRMYHDYETFLFGHAQHFEHELHDDHE
eukprot:jgi/Picre1/29419/NNA_004807.t1